MFKGKTMTTKFLRGFVSAVLAFVLVFLMFTPRAEASEKQTNEYLGDSEKSIALPKSDAELLENTELFENIEDALSEYFCFRNSLFSELEKENDLSVLISHSVYEDAQKRLTALQEMRERIGAAFTLVTTNYRIDSISARDSLAREAIARVTEIIEIDYQYPDSAVVDHFGYEVEHKIGLVYSPVSGSVSIQQDTFYEFIPDICSSDYCFPEYSGYAEGNNACSENEGHEHTRTTYAYNASAAVSYALTWYNTHNPAFYVATSDCANFVSQCLYAGGIPMIAGDYSSGWHADSGGGTGPWENVALANTFWQNHSITRVTVIDPGTNFSDYSLCLAGNPIYYLNRSASGHLMILVGVDSTNTPIFASHNPSEHEAPITALNPLNKTIYTLDFVHRYSIWYNYGNLTKHKRICDVCGDFYYELHDWQLAMKNNEDGGRTVYTCPCGATKVVN